MEDFPENIQSKILSRVPDESVMNCKLVCKRWQQLLSNRKVSLGIFFSFSCSPEPFIHLYYADYDAIKSSKPEEEDEEGEEEDEEENENEDVDEEEEEDENENEEGFYKTKITKINLPPIKEEFDDHPVMVGSCNGLACLALPHKGVYDPVYICNPFTSEYTILPKIKTREFNDVVSGFGYLPSTNEYKVVRMLSPKYGLTTPGSSKEREILVQVYTLGKGSSSCGWRDIRPILSDALFHEGIFANGSLYWKDDCNNKIVAFDLADESFRVLPPPPCIQSPRKDKTIFRLTMLGGYLCLVDHPDDDCIDIWSFRKNKHQANSSTCDVIDQDYYHDWSWSKDFSIEWEQDGSFYEPFALTKNNEVLVWSLSTLKLYDPVTKSLDVIIEEDPFFQTFQGIVHMNSLVSLKDLGVRSKTWVGLVSKKTHLNKNENKD